MRKGKALRLAGFVGAACASVALVATAVETTGAYFTDSHNGTISASTGHLKVNVWNSAGTPVNDLSLSFSDLVPGVYTPTSFSYQTDSTGVKEDLWLYFPAGPEYDAFTGYRDTSTGHDGGLGRYGHFAVSVNGATMFSSYNMANRPPNDTTTPVCTNANGDGIGHAWTNTPNQYCGVPEYIRLATNLASGSSGKVQVTFGLTPKFVGPQDTSLGTGVPFEIVATQAGISPSDQFNNPTS